MENTSLFFPDDTLPAIGAFLLEANVSQSDVLSALEIWKEKPPDDEFENILNAEVIE